MRLTTLARKVELTPKKLIVFLENEGVELDNGVNTKLDENSIHLVLENFAPDQIQDEEIKPWTDLMKEDEANNLLDSDEKESNDVPSKDDIIGEVDTAGQHDDLVVSESEIPTTEEKIGTIDDLEGESIEDIDLIKVKKVKLEGIKVVGKIELPEKPKMKEVEEQVSDELTESEKIESLKERPKPRGKKFDRNRKKNRQGKSHTPLSYEEKLKEEEREKLKKRRRKENEEKRRKKKYYEQNIKPKIAQQSRKTREGKPEESKTPPPKGAIVHKNPLKRLWAWLNGEYDKY